MNERRNDRFTPPAVGGVSLLVVFAVLCLTVFALLGLATVQADVRLANTSARAVSDYYAADCAAQEILARLRNEELPEGVDVDGDTYRFSCPISEGQTLEAEVRLEGGNCTVLRWQAVSSGEWTFDDGLDLWDGFPLF